MRQITSLLFLFIRKPSPDTQHDYEDFISDLVELKIPLNLRLVPKYLNVGFGLTLTRGRWGGGGAGGRPREWGS